MDSRIPKILDEYSSKYTDNAFYLKRNKIRKGTKQPILFIFLGSLSLKYRTGIEEYCSRYFSDLSGVAFLAINKRQDGEEVLSQDSNNCFALEIPDNVYSEDIFEDRENVRIYGDSQEFYDVFESCVSSILNYFMEYGNIYDEGGFAYIHIVSPVDAPEAGIGSKIIELINKFLSHVYNPRFTLFSIYDDINTKKEIKAVSYVTFNEIIDKYENDNSVIVVLIGNKKLNGLFDRPSELADNQCHLMVLTTYISVMSPVELYPANAQTIYSFGISNLKIIERYVGLSTLVCLLTRVLSGLSEQRTNNDEIDVEAEIDKYLKNLSNKGEMVLSQMKKAIYNTLPINGMSIQLSEAERRLFDSSLYEYFNENFIVKNNVQSESFLNELINKILVKNTDIEQLTQRLMHVSSATQDILNNANRSIDEAKYSPLSIYNININGGKQIRELIIKNIYVRELQKQLLNIKVKLIDKLMNQLKAKNRDIAIKYNRLQELLYEVEQYSKGNNLSSAISNYYKSSIEGDIKVPKEFINKSISSIFDEKNNETMNFLENFCSSIINNSMFATIGNTYGMDEQVIGELIGEFNKKSSPYCFTLQIGANINTQKLYFGNTQNNLLNRLTAMEPHTVINDDSCGDSITMLQIFSIKDFFSIDYVSKCKQAFEEMDKHL